MKLIAGLGNPGRDYANNRHNIGFMCLNHFAKTNGIRFDKKQGKARIGIGEVADNKVVVAKPQTYMNLSGQAVSRLVKRYDISLDNLLAIHDDLDLPLGKIRIRPGGGSAGHKGIESVITELGSHDFPRLRVGIGRPLLVEGSSGITEADIVAYVLMDFTSKEKKVVDQILPRVSEAILCFLTEDITAVMNKYNQGLFNQ